MSPHDILRNAQEHLRCIDWSGITRELMTGTVCGGTGVSCDLYGLSRAARPGERISFFMSHSWHDDAESKLRAL